MRSLLICAWMAACSHAGSVSLDAGSLDGGADLSSPSGDLGDGCSDQARLVYVVDANGKFLSFSPATLQFVDLGSLACPAKAGAFPFSMAIDRSATAWVLYSSGELFRVSTSTASCTATSFAVGQQGFVNFGMGYATNAVGSTSETLFIGGGATYVVGTNQAASLASIDTTALTVTKIAALQSWPELTGTGDARLWAFYPSPTAPRIAQIDKANGAESNNYPLVGLAGYPRDWAFAFWGGDFWIFLKRVADSSTQVYRLKTADGSVSTVLANTGRAIVGAGVSTCAPLIM